MRVQHLISIVLILAVTILLGWVVTTYTWEYDWTYANRSSLTKASKRVLASMPGTITFTAYAYPGPKRQVIRDALYRYRRYDDDIRLVFVNPASNPQKMRKLGINKNGVVRVTYEGRSERVKGLTEQQITTALQRVSVAEEQKVVFLAGHGERNPLSTKRGGYSKLRKALNRQGMKVERVNLVQSHGLPENTDVLVIASPRKKLLDAEVAIISDYIADGGNLLWLADPSTIGGLKKLAKQLGIKWSSGPVLYPGYHTLGLTSPAVAVVVKYPNHPITRHLIGMTMYPYAGGIATRRLSDWQAQPIITTPKATWLESGSLDKKRISFSEKAGDKRGPITIGIALTRPKPTNDKAADEATKQQPEYLLRGEQRVVVIADSDFLTNATITNVSNRALGLALFQWLSYRDQQIAVSVPAAPDSYLHLAPWQTRFLWLAFVVALPLLLLTTGVGRWWLRRRR